MSGHEGIEGMAGYHRDALSAYARTQHLNSPSVVDEVDGEQARVRANIAVTHVHHPGTPADPIFAAGTLVTGRARRTQAGWRLAELAFRVLWTTGSPPHRGEV